MKDKKRVERRKRLQMCACHPVYLRHPVLLLLQGKHPHHSILHYSKSSSFNRLPGTILPEPGLKLDRQPERQGWVMEAAWRTHRELSPIWPYIKTQMSGRQGRDQSFDLKIKSLSSLLLPQTMEWCLQLLSSIGPLLAAQVHLSWTPSVREGSSPENAFTYFAKLHLGIFQRAGE